MASTNDWFLIIHKGKYTGLIFIDLKNAFDTVDHEILVKKLKMYGVTGLEHDWFHHTWITVSRNNSAGQMAPPLM